MSTKLFCDLCGNEVSLAGNNYSSSNAIFARSGELRYDGWLMVVTIRKKTSGKAADLCRNCRIDLMKRGMEQVSR